MFGLTEKKRKQIIISGLFLAAALVWVGLWQAPDSELKLTFFDVGQGDAILIRTPQGHKILVDGGPNQQVLAGLGEYLPFWDRTLDLVVVSHPDADHLTGLLSVLENYQVRQVLIGFESCETALCREFLKLLESRGISKLQVITGDHFFEDGLRLDVLWPGKGCTFSTNDCSTVLLLDFGEFEAVLPGDLGEQGQQALGKLSINGPVELLKVPHHGADCLLEGFLGGLSPEIAVISVGKNNGYGHPTTATLDKLKGIGTKIWRTDLDGTVEVFSDGRKWQVR